MIQAVIQQATSFLKPLISTLATHQNRGFFTHRGQVQVPAQGNPRVCLPQGLDLRASGPGFHNQPTRLTLSHSGEAVLHMAEQTIVLGPLSQRVVEQGWIITGLRLRGALRFTESGVVLMVPDREDLPYLLQVLTPRATANADFLPRNQALAA
jgi:hypothetical protein